MQLIYIQTITHFPLRCRIGVPAIDVNAYPVRNNAMPSHPDGSCSIEDHTPIQSVNAEEILAEVDNEFGINDPLLLTDLQSACTVGNEDWNKNTASMKNHIVTYEGKRRKLYQHNVEPTCPNDPFIPFKRDRKRHIFKAMLLITKYQNDLIDATDILAHSKWINYIFNPDEPQESRYNCYYCSRYINDENEFILKDGPRSTLSEIDGELRVGENAKRRNKEIIQSHARLSTHATVMQRFEEMYLAKIKYEIEDDVKKNEPPQFKITNRHMSLVFRLCKSRLPLSSHIKITEVARLKWQTSMGNLCRTEHTAANMAKAISDVYVQELKQALLESDSFISIMADGGEDNTLQHYVSVLFQFLDADKNIRVVFYKLIPLGASSSGLAYFEALRTQLIEDDLWDYFGAKLTSVATDSASNMVSIDKGFSNRLKRALGRPNAIVHKCIAHTLELMLEAALRTNVCPNCIKLDKALKAIYNFFHPSPKRNASLENYCKLNFQNRKCYNPKRVMDIRWVSSHLQAAKELYNGWDILVGFCQSLPTDIEYAAPNDSNKTTKRKAYLMERLLLQKDFLSSLTFQMDVQRIFQLVSEFLQKKGQSILGAYAKKKNLIDGLNKLLEGKGDFLDLFLSEAKCGDLACGNLLDFENEDSIAEWRGQVLHRQSVELVPFQCEEDMETNVVPAQCDENMNKDRRKKKKKKDEENKDENDEKDKKDKKDALDIQFDIISLQKDAYVRSLLQKVEEKMPTTELLRTVSYLDQSQWPLNIRACLSDMELKAQIERWPKLFGLEFEENVMWNDFEKVVSYLEENCDFWYAHHYSETTDFYSLLLKTMKSMPEKFKMVLEMSLVCPLSTADPER